MVQFEDRNIVLTGFMGTGKSTVGRRLAKRLDFTWVDTDRLIEERHGSIEEIFARAGEGVFRGIERNIARELSTRTRCVISTGGKMLLAPDNIRALSTAGRIFCLTVAPDVLVARLLASPTPRPLLSGPDPGRTIRELLAERQRGYARFAAVDTTGATPDEATEAVYEVVTTSTATSTGRRGVAVIGDAATGLPTPVVVVSDPDVAQIHGPCLGPVAGEVSSAEEADRAGTLVFLGGTSVTRGAGGSTGPRQVVVPTTPTAMAEEYPSGVRVVVDLATLQTLTRREIG